MSVTANLTTNVETITATIVVEDETIIAEINTAARGPAGPAGGGTGSIDSTTTSDGTADLDLLNVDTVTATVTGTLTADHIHGNLAGNVYGHVRAGEALAKGDPVYVSGSHGSGSSLIPIVSKADASNAAKMPAVGIMDAAVANNASGHMVIVGTITELNTAGYTVNAELYVDAGGGFTATPPSARAQPVARVERANANNGAVIVKVNGLSASDATASTLVRRDSSGGAVFGAGPLEAFSLVVTGGTTFGEESLLQFDAIEYYYGTGAASAHRIALGGVGDSSTGTALFGAATAAAALTTLGGGTAATGTGAVVLSSSPTITTPTISRASTGQVFLAQDNNGASINFTTDSFGRGFFNINGKSGAVATAGAYVLMTGFEESWVTLNVTANTSGQRVMRFGNLSNRFSIQRLNDAINTITSTPFSFANNAPTNSFYMDSSGNTGFGTSSPTAFLDVNSNTVRLRTARTPASATAAGNAGDICWDANYIYVCTATNTWKRTAISTWP